MIFYIEIDVIFVIYEGDEKYFEKFVKIVEMVIK